MPNPLKFNITHTIDVYHLQLTGNKETYPVSPDASGIDCQLLPASTDIVVYYPNIPAYQLYDAFIFTDDQILIGDRVKDSDNRVFIVRGVTYKVDTVYMSYQRLALQLNV